MNKDLIEKNVVRTEECKVEVFDSVMTRFGEATVERIWLVTKISVDGARKHQSVNELLGYRVAMPRKIVGDICLTLVDAISSAENRYQRIMEKVVKKISE